MGSVVHYKSRSLIYFPWKKIRLKGKLNPQFHDSCKAQALAGLNERIFFAKWGVRSPLQGLCTVSATKGVRSFLRCVYFQGQHPKVMRVRTDGFPSPPPFQPYVWCVKTLSLVSTSILKASHNSFCKTDPCSPLSSLFSFGTFLIGNNIGLHLQVICAYFDIHNKGHEDILVSYFGFKFCRGLTKLCYLIFS